MIVDCAPTGETLRVQREPLLTMRTMIDHYLQRLDEAEAAATGPRVEEMPIE